MVARDEISKLPSLHFENVFSPRCNMTRRDQSLDLAFMRV
jgi:hypothetical protein